MVSFHFLRVIGIVLLLGSLLGAVVSTGDGSWPQAVFWWCCVGVGLYVAVLGDKGISRYKTRHAEDRKQRALNFNGSDFSARLRWVRCLFTSAVVGLLVWVSAIAALTGYSQKKFILVVPAVVFCAVLLVSFLSLFHTLYIACMNNRLVHLNIRGLTLWGGAPIAWSMIDGVDLQEVEVKGKTQYTLILAIRQEYFSSRRAFKWADWLHWTAPRAQPASRTLTVPCALLDVDPHLLSQAVKVIADRFGGRRVKEWSRFIPIDEAIANRDRLSTLDDINRNVDRLLVRLSALDSKSSTASNEMREIDRTIQGALQQSSKLNDEHLKAVQFQADRTAAKLSKLKWIGFALLLFVIVTLGLKIISVLGR